MACSALKVTRSKWHCRASRVHICQFQIGFLCFTKVYLVTLCALPWIKMISLFFLRNLFYQLCDCLSSALNRHYEGQRLDSKYELLQGMCLGKKDPTLLTRFQKDLKNETVFINSVCLLHNIECSIEYKAIERQTICLKNWMNYFYLISFICSKCNF